MEWKLDLHIHSRRSPDGRMTLSEIIRRAKAAGLNGCAVCDHDGVLTPEERKTARLAHPDFLLIPGTEVSTDRGHLLGLFVTETVKAASFSEAAEAIRAQGGLAVLAHPFARSRDAARLLPLLPALDGVEVWNSRAERKNGTANAQAAAFAAEHGLLPFAGSDAHVPEEIGNGYLSLPAEALTEQAIRAALLAGTGRASGVRSRAVDTARSQLTKRRKTHAGPLAYGKWALFAAKCAAQDLFTVR